MFMKPSGTGNPWKKTTGNTTGRQRKKDRIKAAFARTVKVTVIPATKLWPPGGGEDGALRVAAYCRVSTSDAAQAGSFELQIRHYREMIENTPGWQLAGIFADEGASGTSMEKRTEFLRLIACCRAGQIDRVITKSVSRFARNTRDFLKVVRMFKERDPPVSVFFETEGIDTLKIGTEMQLGILSLFAQAESEQKSESVTWAFIRRFEKGIPLVSTHNFLGFDRDDFGEIVKKEDEAVIVRRIYDSYIRGLSSRQIAENLTADHIPTVTGKAIWRAEAVLSILHNEKYCGDVVMQKTFTVNCFTHKKKKNTGQRLKYEAHGILPVIVSKKKWKHVEALLKTRRSYRTRAGKPKNTVTTRQSTTGILSGFVYIDPDWNTTQVEQVLAKPTEERNLEHV